MLQHLESIHYIVGVLAAVGSFALWVVKMHIQMLEQKIDLQDKFNREHADNCLNGLKEINAKLDDLKADIAKHNAEYSVLRVEVDAVKEQVGKLSAWFTSLIDRK